MEHHSACWKGKKHFGQHNTSHTKFTCQWYMKKTNMASSVLVTVYRWIISRSMFCGETKEIYNYSNKQACWPLDYRGPLYVGVNVNNTTQCVRLQVGQNLIASTVIDMQILFIHSTSLPLFSPIKANASETVIKPCPGKRLPAAFNEALLIGPLFAIALPISGTGLKLEVQLSHPGCTLYCKV